MAPHSGRLRLLSILAGAVACSEPAATNTPESEASTGAADTSSTGGETTSGDDPSGGTVDAVLLEPVARLVRVSMALRGVRPSVSDLQAIAADPERLPEFVDDYLSDERFGETIREFANDALLVAIENPYPAIDGLADQYGLEIARSVNAGPLRLVEYVVVNDRPFTDIVTADYSVVDATTAEFWGAAFDPGAGTLQVADSQPGPPAAGILSDGALFIRHRSDASNYHRGRANLISKALLCTDFLDRDIEVDSSINLADPDATSEAVRSNPSCVGCHQSLDAMASFFWGWRGTINNNQITQYPLDTAWVPAQVDRWKTTTGRAPSYFGIAGDDLSDLGQLIADDPRFSLCAVRRAYAFFHQVELAEVPLEAAAELQAELIESGFSLRQMIRAMVLADDFAISHSDDPVVAETVVGYIKVRPSQLARSVEDLTGFRWQTNIDAYLPLNRRAGDIDLLRSSSYGFAVLAGGMDSRAVEQVASTVNATTSLVIRSLAHEAAGFVVAHDLAPATTTATLLVGASASDQSEADVRAALAALHLRILGEDAAADSASVDAAWTLWASVADESNPTRAWQAVVAAMLQDHRVIYY